MAENLERVTYTREGTLRYRINQFAIVFICVWAITPFVRARIDGVTIIPVFGLWLITTDLKWLTEKWTKDMIFLAVFFATFLPYLITGNLRYGIHGPRMILVLFPIFFIGIFVNHYYMHYKKDYNTLGKIAFFSLIAFSIASVQTFLGLRIYPNAAKFLANGNTSEVAKEMYARLGIGGYEFVYAGIFMLILAMYPMMRKTDAGLQYKLLCVVAFVALVVLIATASFTIALLMSIAGVMLVFFGRNKKSILMLVVIFTLFFLIFSDTLLANILIKFAAIFRNNEGLNFRLLDLADNLLADSLSGMTGGRISRYSESALVFLKNPFFGISGPFGDRTAQIRGHSGWLDTLALFGLFTGVPLFLSIYYYIKKNMAFFKNSTYLTYYTVVSYMFALLGVINSTITVYPIGIMFFLIAPTIYFLPYAFVKNEDRQLEL